MASCEEHFPSLTTHLKKVSCSTPSVNDNNDNVDDKDDNNYDDAHEEEEEEEEKWAIRNSSQEGELQHTWC